MWQGLNSWFTSRLGTAARVSVSLSMLAIVNTLYKYIYYTLYRKVRLPLILAHSWIILTFTPSTI